MYLYNSVTHKKEEFRTHTPGHVEMYTCGPTVYHFAHIGNLRSYIMEDVLEKYLRYVGYDVNRVMNITDVGHLTSDADEGEDKMLKGARREHKTVMEIAQFYTDAFFEDCRKLNIKRPDVVQPATGLIDDYIQHHLPPAGEGLRLCGRRQRVLRHQQAGAVLRVQRPQRGGSGRRRPGGRGGGREQAQQERLCAVVHQVQVRGSGPEVGFPVGRGLPRLAHRVLRHLHEVQR